MHLLHLAWFNKSQKATYFLEKVLDATFYRSYKTPCSICSLCVLESGLSDFHGRAAYVMKIPFRKLPPNVIAGSDFKKSPSAMSRKIFISYFVFLRQKSGNLVSNPNVFLGLHWCTQWACILLPKKKKWEEKEKKEYIRAEIKPFMAKTF